MALGGGQAYDNEVDCDDIGIECYGGSRACYVQQGGDTSGDISSRVGADSFVALLLNEDLPHDMNLLEENDGDIDRDDGINCSSDGNNDPSDDDSSTSEGALHRENEDYIVASAEKNTPPNTKEQHRLVGPLSSSSTVPAYAIAFASSSL
ncbi:hypothetical protein PI124_g16713 [Phytophthora idaei]|nr:hypothetical protein PI125_g20102 [Phytophthora idaei]KAG3140629.1 hypothetical protein PI126_g15897 [Phytophthora idaei]KAG3238329.1 hypothetical protein PI124_g16713 [Phytophthora idaei]